MTNELYHYGVIGMKWGIRRYQNYDGSYTKAGMKRYNESKKQYDLNNERYKNAKKSGASKTEITNAKLARKKSRVKLKKDYRHLKQDRLADQGKNIYSRGKTITGNDTATRVLSTIGSLSLSAAAYNYKTGSFGNGKITNILTAVGGVSVGTAAAKKLTDAYQAKRLRAYYSHSSHY